MDPLSNRAFLEAHGAPARVGLAGGTAFPDRAIRRLQRPLHPEGERSAWSHAFLFNAGNIDKKFYMDTLQLEESEYNLIRFPQRGVCLYKCGNERYNLVVHAPAYKEKLFGKAGGR